MTEVQQKCQEMVVGTGSKANDELPFGPDIPTQVECQPVEENNTKPNNCECPLTRKVELQPDQKHTLCMELARHFVSLGLQGYLTVIAYDRGDTGLFVLNMVIWWMHAFIRGIMDYKYDCMLLKGTQLRIHMAQLQMLNYTQMRHPYDIKNAFNAGIVGMPLLTTRVVEALLKQMPQTVLAVVSLYNAMYVEVENEVVNNQSDFRETLTLVVAAVAIPFYVWLNSNIMNTFETTMNAKTGAVAGKTRIYFLLDTLIRTITLGTYISVISKVEEIDTFFIVLPILEMYLLRAALLFSVYYARNFIYSPKEQEDEHGKKFTPPTDGSSRRAQALFSFFPAGFVQLFTDFPFNGDLASKAKMLRIHQFWSCLENAMYLTVALVYMEDAYDMNDHSVGVYVIPAIAFLCIPVKAFFFQEYYYPNKCETELTSIAMSKRVRRESSFYNEEDPSGKEQADQQLAN